MPAMALRYVQQRRLAAAYVKILSMPGAPASGERLHACSNQVQGHTGRRLVPAACMPAARALHVLSRSSHLLRLRQRACHPNRQGAAARAKVGPSAAGQLRGCPGCLFNKVYHELRLWPGNEHAGTNCTGPWGKAGPGGVVVCGCGVRGARETSGQDVPWHTASSLPPAGLRS